MCTCSATVEHWILMSFYVIHERIIIDLVTRHGMVNIDIGQTLHEFLFILQTCKFNFFQRADEAIPVNSATTFLV